MEDDLHYLANWNDDLNFKVNGRRPQFVCKRETTSICWQREDNLNLLATGKASFLALAFPELDTAQPQLVLGYF